MPNSHSDAEPRPLLSLIVAMSRNRVIGRDNRLPWRLPADLQFFKRTTLGKPIVMGRRTFESIGRPLPERINIIVTTRGDYQAAGCIVTPTLEQALAAAAPAAEIMVIGGASLFAQCLERADRIYLTLVDAVIAGDAYFPELNPAQWRESRRDHHPADDRHSYAFSFILLERGPPPAIIPPP